MLSYLTSNSNSSSISTKGMDDLLAFKKQMIAVPAGSKTLSQLNVKKNKKNKRKDKLTSLTYNVVAGRPIIARSIPLTILTVEMRQSADAFFSTSATVPSLLGINFTVSNFAVSSSYLALFDQYKIDHLEVWLEPQFSQSTVSANTGGFYTCIDLDDANTPGSYQDVEGHQTAISSTGQTSHYHSWKPHMAVAVYSGAFTSFENAPANWIDSASSGVQHFGVKVASTATAVIQRYNLYVRGLVSFRQAGL